MKWASVVVCALGLASAFAVENPERYIQCRDGEIQILPALEKDEIPRGSVNGVEAVGGFVFDIEWRENKMTRMRVLSKEGGVCRIRSYGGMGSPLLRKAKHDCANPAIAATKDVEWKGIESVFTRADHPLSSICVEFDTEPGEILEFRGVSGNQDWTDYSKSLSDDFLKTSEAARIAQNVLDWQLDTGGWPKNVPMHEKLTAKERAKVLSFKSEKKRGTIDNAATFSEMRILARFYKANSRQDSQDSLAAKDAKIAKEESLCSLRSLRPEKEYLANPVNPVKKPSSPAEAALQGVVKGLDFLLYLQYPNGGWPQCDPAKKGYWHQITFNDGAMINVMNTLRDIYESRPPFDIPIPDEKKAAARAAFDKGLRCILKTQVKQNGKLTVWCQQHDRDTLAPCMGRAFELPSLCSLESLDIARFLMSLNPEDYPEDCPDSRALPRVKFSEIRAAIEGARDWYAATPIHGYRIEDNWRRPDGILARRLVKDPDAKPLWCRYYTLDDNRPFTGTRQSTMNFDFSEMEQGENMSYMWFNTTGEAMAREYPRWEKRIAKRLALAEAQRHAKTTEWRGGKGSGGMPYIQADRDTWENPDNWSNGVPGEEDTVVFAKDATLWSMKRGEEFYACGRLVFRNGACVTLASNYEKNGAVNPNIRPRAIEGEGTLTLVRAGLQTKDGETLVVPATVSIVADTHEGRDSWLRATEWGRLVVKGRVSCPGKSLNIFDTVILEGELTDLDKVKLGPRVVLKNPPKRDPVTLTVAAGESLQAVLDAIPENAPAPYIVRVAPGRYREKVRVSGNRANIRLVADDPRPGKTVISWNDTPATPGPDGRNLGTNGSATLTVSVRDFEMVGFTVENTATPERLAATDGKEQAGQCVALSVSGDRCAFRKCRILGWQDTLFAGGAIGETPARQYFEDCYIEGSVDFIFGGSVALFNRCELHSHAGGFVTAGSHAADLPFGYVFAKCRVTCGEGKQTSLGRPWRPYANVTFIGCDFGDAVIPGGWTDWTTACGERVYRSAEYACTSRGKVERGGNIIVGGVPELRERLSSASLRSLPDIISGPDHWHPMSPWR